MEPWAQTTALTLVAKTTQCVEKGLSRGCSCRRSGVRPGASALFPVEDVTSWGGPGGSHRESSGRLHPAWPTNRFCPELGGRYSSSLSLTPWGLGVSCPQSVHNQPSAIRLRHARW